MNFFTINSDFDHPERKGHGAKVPGSKMARERKGQGASWPGSESARVLLADSLRGSELAREQKGSVTIRWNQLDQRAVGASSINAFKGCLNKIRETWMGFFMD